jgi:hypothetical protein
LINKQRANAIIWEEKINKLTNLKSLIPKKNSIPNSWVYGVLATKKLETIKNFREKGLYATSVHINNNIYSVFNNKIELKGVNEFINHFVAIPSGWWFNH